MYLALTDDEQESGFSLIELIVTVVIIGIIAAIAIPVFLNVQDNARQSAVEAAAASAVGAVQEETLNGATQFDSVLADFETEDISLSLLSDGFVVGDPDTVCIQASHLRADNVAVSGACLDGVSEEQNADEEEQEYSGTMELVWDVNEQRAEESFLRGSEFFRDSITGLNVVLPIQGSVSGTVDWGDGTVEELTGDNPSHTYSEEGVYTITLENAQFDSLSVGEVVFDVESQSFLIQGLHSDSSGLISVDDWSDTGTVNASSAFLGASDLSYVNEPPETVEDMSFMFSFATSFNQNISGWGTSDVTDMTGMFMFSSFNRDIGGWDTSSVTGMTGMFGFNGAFNQDVSDWNVSNVESMGGMFLHAEAFNNGDTEGESSIPLDWNTSSLLDMENMFYSARSFNQSISNWDVSNVSSMNNTFYYATEFNQDVSGWDVSNVRDMERMFGHSESFNNGGESLSWGTTTGNVTNMRNMFSRAHSFNADISGWDVSNVTHMNFMFQNASSFNQDISNWDVSNVEETVQMFRSASMFNNGDTAGETNNSLEWNIPNLRDATSMFSFASSFNQDISGWDTSNVVIMNSMFSGNATFNQDLSGWDVSNVEERYLFNYNSALEEQHIPPAFR